jgi:hypothetical protein
MNRAAAPVWASLVAVACVSELAQTRLIRCLRVEDGEPPNPRVQRTRSSPSARHEPLTRHPLGATKSSLR